MPDRVENFFVAPFPWVNPDDFGSQTDSLPGRSFLFAPATFSRVSCDECGGPLPEVANLRRSGADAWKKYELPRGDGDDPVSRLTLSSDDSLEEFSYQVPLGKGISRSLLDDRLEDPDLEPTGELRKYRNLRDLIDTYVDFVNDLSDRKKSKPFYWEGDCDGYAIRSFARTTRSWIRADEKDDARLALIVKLAREIARPLGYVCDNPRVVLRRSRELQKIATIQEVDAACLRWLVRQPGRDIYERAGTRQELLGVARIEDPDTPENRVIKDLLHRARVECANYCSLYRNLQHHHRVRTVDRFRRKIQDWQNISDINRAKQLVGTAQPNYVLLHEPKYHQLWEAYRLLLSQQQQKDQIWKWRDRTFSEACELGIWSSLAKISKSIELGKSDVYFRSEANAGCFVSQRTELSPITHGISKSPIDVTIIRGSQVRQFPGLPRKLNWLSADFLICGKEELSQQLTIIPVWCLLDAKADQLSESYGLELLSAKLSALEESITIHPLILTFQSDSQSELSFFRDQGRVMQLTHPLSKSLRAVESFILNGIEFG